MTTNDGNVHSDAHSRGGERSINNDPVWKEFVQLGMGPGSTRIYEELCGKSAKEENKYLCSVQITSETDAKTLTFNQQRQKEIDMIPLPVRKKAEQAIKGLQSEDAKERYKSIETIKNLGSAALPLLCRDLDADKYKTREAASKMLVTLGDKAAPALFAAMDDKSAPEAARRAKFALETIVKTDKPHELKDDQGRLRRLYDANGKLTVSADYSKDGKLQEAMIHDHTFKAGANGTFYRVDLGPNTTFKSVTVDDSGSVRFGDPKGNETEWDGETEHLIRFYQEGKHTSTMLPNGTMIYPDRAGRGLLQLERRRWGTDIDA